MSAVGQGAGLLDTVFAPLRITLFRTLWLVWLTANMTLWMTDVSVSWVMADITRQPFWVAMVQAVVAVPMFLLGVPCGALADLVDRRRLFAFAQAWMAALSAVLACGYAFGWLDVGWLLVLSLANGMGLALRFPVFAAIVPDVVPRERLIQALALNSLAINITRVAGPMLAGVLMSWGSPTLVFSLNAVLSFVAFVAVLRSGELPRRERKVAGGLLRTMREGLGYARRSPGLRHILGRTGLVYVQAMALTALLPLVARGLDPSPRVYTLMLSSLGVGAVLSVFLQGRVAGLARPDRIVAVGQVLHACGMAVCALSPFVWLSCIALVAAGAAWLLVVNTLTVSAQLLIPREMQARGMSIYQIAIFGSSAVGAASWGQIAQRSSVSTALLVAAVASVLVLGLTRSLSAELKE